MEELINQIQMTVLPDYGPEVAALCELARLMDNVVEVAEVIQEKTHASYESFLEDSGWVKSYSGHWSNHKHSHVGLVFADTAMGVELDVALNKLDMAKKKLGIAGG